MTQLIGYGLITSMIGATAYVTGLKSASIRNVFAIESPPDVLALHRENAQLEREIGRITRLEERLFISPPAADAEHPDHHSWRIERMRHLAELSEKEYAHVRIRPIVAEGKLGRGFKEIFALTPSEEAALQDCIDNTRGELARLTLERAIVRQPTDTTLEIEVPPFVEEGGQIYDALIAQFAKILGQERNDMFRSLVRDSLERSLNYSGAAIRTVTITQIIDPNDHGKVEGYQIVHGVSTGASAYSSGPHEFSELYMLGRNYGEDLATIIRQYFSDKSSP